MDTESDLRTPEQPHDRPLIISDICLYGDCDCDMPGCICECHDENGCDHDH